MAVYREGQKACQASEGIGERSGRADRKSGQRTMRDKTPASLERPAGCVTRPRAPAAMSAWRHVSTCCPCLSVWAVQPPPAEHIAGCRRGGTAPTIAGGYQAGVSVGTKHAPWRSSSSAWRDGVGAGGVAIFHSRVTALSAALTA